MKKTMTISLVTLFSLLLASAVWAYFSPEPPLTSRPNTAVQPLIGGGESSRQTSPVVNKYDPWPKTPPKIGRLVLKQEYWNYMKEAARKYQVSPYLIQAVCAIESRYDPYATSGRGQCIGLMQLHRGTAKKYQVDPWNPRENIMGGAAVLAHLLTICNGDLHRVLNIYNATCTSAYEREVIKAFRAAMDSGMGIQLSARSRH